MGRMSLGMCLCIASLVASSAAGAFAQTPVVPTPIKKLQGATFTEKVNVPYGDPKPDSVWLNDEHPLEALTRVYNSGDGVRLNGLAMELLATLSCRPEFFDLPTGVACPGATAEAPARLQFDFKRDYVLLTWVGVDFSGKRVIYRIGVHRRLKDPYNLSLPGVTGPELPKAGQPVQPNERAIYEVFLAPSPVAEHSSVYVFTPQANPLEAQVPAFVAAATGPLFASAGKLIGTINFVNRQDNASVIWNQPPPILRPPPVLTVRMARVKPPMDRAKVKVNDVAKQPIPIEDFKRQLSELASKLGFLEARQSTCAGEFAEMVAESLGNVAESDECTDEGTTAEKCRAAFDAKIRQSLTPSENTCRLDIETKLKAENEARKPADRLTEAQLTAEAEKQYAPHKAAFQQVDGELRKFVVAQQPERLTGESTFTNTPLTRWSFGALTSFILDASSERPRVKVGNDGKLVADPLPRGMTLVVVNWSPVGYDPEERPMSWHERIRPFAGIVATPEFGLAVGGTIGIWKGVGFNVGRAWLFVPTTRDSDKLGEPPSEPTNAFAAARAGAWFVGASYNFK